jgi:hypothetical protein
LDTNEKRYLEGKVQILGGEKKPPPEYPAKS